VLLLLEPQLLMLLDILSAMQGMSMVTEELIL
jgi:hypothetical protein